MLPCLVILSQFAFASCSSGATPGAAHHRPLAVSNPLRSLIPFLSHSSALFRHSQKENCRVFKYFHTLAAKHPGWHTLLPFHDSETATASRLTPFVETLTNNPQRIENPAGLSPVFAVLTQFAICKPFCLTVLQETPGPGYSLLSAGHFPLNRIMCAPVKETTR